MPAALKFRLCALQLPEDFLISSLRLFDSGVAVDAGAAIASSVPPASGLLEGLRDGSGCSWDGAAARAPGFYIEWSFPALTNVTDLVYEGSPLRGALVVCDGQAAELVQTGAGFHILGAVETLAALAPDFLWKLDASGVNQVDLVSGAVATRSGGSIVAAAEQVGQPLAFAPGSNGYVSADIGSFNSGNFSAVFDLLTVGTSNTVVLECGDNEGWSVQVDTGGYFKINIGGVASGGLNTTFQIGDGVPRRLGITYRRADRLGTLYVEGAVLAQKVLGTPNSATALTIGSRFGAFPIGAGSRIADVALWRRTLSAEEMRQTKYRDTRDWLLPRAGVHRTYVAIKGEPSVSQGLQAITALTSRKLLDVECGGQGRIYGTVSRKETPANVPLRRRVRLHRSVDGYLARETWSKSDGSYEFREISTRYEWDVIAWDHELQEYSTVANNQLAEVA